MKRKGKFFTDPIFRQTVYFLLGGTPAELRGYFEQAHGEAPPFEDNIAGLQWKANDKERGKPRFYVWIDKPDLDTLVHEISHLVPDVMRELDMPISQDTEEVTAYLTEFYFRYISALIPRMVKRPY